jgi:hypothetical protein
LEVCALQARLANHLVHVDVKATMPTEPRAQADVLEVEDIEPDLTEGVDWESSLEQSVHGHGQDSDMDLAQPKQNEAVSDAGGIEGGVQDSRQQSGCTEVTSNSKDADSDKEIEVVIAEIELKADVEQDVEEDVTATNEQSEGEAQQVEEHLDAVPKVLAAGEDGAESMHVPQRRNRRMRAFATRIGRANKKVARRVMGPCLGVSSDQ